MLQSNFRCGGKLQKDTVIPGKITGEIEVSNLSFTYQEEKVLKNLSFYIWAREYLGIAGSSDCGKITVVNLLLGFEKPIQGKSFYDGIDMENIRKEELCQKFGIVLQEDQLIPGSIYENITLMSQELSKNRLEQVIKEVGLWTK